MPRITLWNNGKQNTDYRFLDNVISEFMNASGTGIFCHLLLGTYGQNGEPDKPIWEIQDVVLQENRDRKYSKEVYELRGTYNLGDADFDLRQFGLFLSGDTVFLEVHYNDMLRLVGRKIIAGDVIELPHRRDTALLNEGPAINKFYVVEDASFASSGWGSTWLPHIWRLKVVPMTNSQEFQDILEKPVTDPFGLEKENGGTIGDSGGTNEEEVNEAIVDEARKYVSKRNFDTRQFYMVPGNETTSDNPWIWAGDGIPPNGALLVGEGYSFPDDAQDGDYFLRTDYMPHALFKRDGSVWRMQELDYRGKDWSAMHRLYEYFLNNTENTTLQDGAVINTRQALSKFIKPSADFWGDGD